MAWIEALNQDRNGVRVRVHRFDDGTTVDCDCHCFGNSQRAHTNPNCPVLKRADPMTEER